MNIPTSDFKGVVRVLAHHEAVYLLSTATAQMLDSLSDSGGWQGPSTSIAPSPDPENLSRLADAMFSLGARPTVPSSEDDNQGESWSPWPSTVENLCGTYDTDLGRLVIEQPCRDEQLDKAVTLYVAGHGVRMPRRGATHLSPRTSALLAEPL